MNGLSPEALFADALKAVSAQPYDRFGDRTQAVFAHLRDASASLSQLVPNHYLVPYSQGVGNLPSGLWVAVLDPDVTITPTKGLYLVYLFDVDRSSVSLSLNQGVTAAGSRARDLGVSQRSLLRTEAQGLRSIVSSNLSGLEADLSLGRGGLLPNYEAGNVFGRRYELADLVSPQTLKEDLDRFLDLYAYVVSAADDRLRSGVGGVALPPRSPDVVIPQADVRFEPKDASDYRAHIVEHQQVRSRAHEGLVRRLGEWSRTRGFTPNTNVHPRDLVLHQPLGGPDILVEVKVFPAGRPREAVRSAIGQLFEYRLFFASDETRLVACLSADPGGAYHQLFDSLGIAAMWPTGSAWHGTRDAQRLNLLTA